MKARIYLVALSLVLVTSFVWAAEPVKFADANLKEVVEINVDTVDLSPDASESASRVIHFPKDRSIGKLYMRDRDIPMNWRNSFMPGMLRSWMRSLLLTLITCF